MVAMKPPEQQISHRHNLPVQAKSRQLESKLNKEAKKSSKQKASSPTSTTQPGKKKSISVLN